jgi:hypothetical protein
MDGASLSVVTPCEGALGSSPAVSPVTSPASEDFDKPWFVVSIFAIYASQDASYRVFEVLFRTPIVKKGGWPGIVRECGL